jgi:hypothetical protein
MNKHEEDPYLPYDSNKKSVEYLHYAVGPMDEPACAT